MASSCVTLEDMLTLEEVNVGTKEEKTQRSAVVVRLLVQV